jgi:hypothetical protein
MSRLFGVKSICDSSEFERVDYQAPGGVCGYIFCRRRKVARETGGIDRGI